MNHKSIDPKPKSNQNELLQTDDKQMVIPPIPGLSNSEKNI